LRAKRSNPGERQAPYGLLDRRVAPLLAMTIPNAAGAKGKGMTHALETGSNTTSGANRKRRRIFFIFIARNPLKSPDSEK
jgi:hypothetical protein